MNGGAPLDAPPQQQTPQQGPLQLHPQQQQQSQQQHQHDVYGNPLDPWSSWQLHNGMSSHHALAQPYSMPTQDPSQYIHANAQLMSMYPAPSSLLGGYQHHVQAHAPPSNYNLASYRTDTNIHLSNMMQSHPMGQMIDPNQLHLGGAINHPSNLAAQPQLRRPSQHQPMSTTDPVFPPASAYPFYQSTGIAPPPNPPPLSLSAVGTNSGNSATAPPHSGLLPASVPTSAAAASVSAVPSFSPSSTTSSLFTGTLVPMSNQPVPATSSPSAPSSPSASTATMASTTSSSLPPGLRAQMAAAARARAAAAAAATQANKASPPISIPPPNLSSKTPLLPPVPTTALPAPPMVPGDRLSGNADASGRIKSPTERLAEGGAIGMPSLKQMQDELKEDAFWNSLKTVMLRRAVVIDENAHHIGEHKVDLYRLFQTVMVEGRGGERVKLDNAWSKMASLLALPTDASSSAQLGEIYEAALSHYETTWASALLKQCDRMMAKRSAASGTTTTTTLHSPSAWSSSGGNGGSRFEELPLTSSTLREELPNQVPNPFHAPGGLDSTIPPERPSGFSHEEGDESGWKAVGASVEVLLAGTENPWATYLGTETGGGQLFGGENV